MSCTEIDILLTEDQLKRVCRLVVDRLPQEDHDFDGFLTHIFMTGVEQLEKGNEHGAG